MKPAWRRSIYAFTSLLLALGAAGQVKAGCTVSSGGLAFGTYQPLTFAGRLASSDKTSSATVLVVCSGIVTGGGYTLTLGPSLAGAGNRISTRYLSNTSGGDHMAFNLYRDPGHASIWGDGITAGSVLSGSIAVGTSSQSQSFYGKIPAGQNTLKVGSFAGPLTMTLTYNP